MAKILDVYVTDYVSTMMLINALEHSKAADKILHTLHYLCLSVGRELEPNIIKIDLPLTQQDLANIMGLTRETTGIELNRLRKSGLLNYSRKHCVVNLQKLRKVLGEEEFKDLKL
jgi:CRP/FNR family transcriptional regulator